ncbi:TylF/MycF/NovP-related O-methyltransferase [Klebsiella indica]|uniref:TylF/MycF/NovP-related O-methyltransferase n=1 Tax=Klebsiella TaxID=570 RepID=UPI0031B6D956
MKTVVLLGAGQMGRNAALLLNEQALQLLAFGDNAATRQSTAHYPPVLSVAAALALRPDVVFVSVAAKERGLELEQQARAAGYHGPIFRLDTLQPAIDIRGAMTRRIAGRLNELHTEGVVAELGVYQGNFARLLNAVFPDKSLYLFDTFRGFAESDIDTEKAHGFPPVRRDEFCATSVEAVMARMPHQARVIIREGHFPGTATGIEERFAFVSLDADLYAPTLSGLEWFYPRLVPNGCILLHDYHNARFPGVKQAMSDFENQAGRLCLVPLCDLHGSVLIVRN